ncbi:MAG: N-acetylmuramoyl-L-alanine amidase [Lachnospiraceae bacterium]|nr:N-acetylmuramoyl-L-alanine amidase [Lachnospiraceae bacterium]
MERNGSKPGSRTVRTVDRHAAGTMRQSGNAARAQRMGRAKDVSGISYIGASPYRGNARPVQSIKRRRARRRREILSKLVIAVLMVTCLVMIYYITGGIYRMTHKNKEEKPLPVTAEQAFIDDSSDTGISPPEVIQDLLEINEYSRPGDKMGRISNIFVHYTANPGTSAAQNRSYFANLAETHERSASAHLIIGYDGELIQCIPFDEQAYAVMTRNEDSISIECCYLSDDGSFTQETYDTLIHTLAWLVDKFDLSAEDILRHYDCGGKLCPLYYAENESAWNQLRQDVEAYLEQARQEKA